MALSRESRFRSEVAAQKSDVVTSTRVGGLANHRRLCGPDHGQQQFRVDLTGTQVGVPVGARACGIARIVAVHKVYATGDGDNAVDSIDECLPAAQVWQVSKQKPIPKSPM